MMPLAFAWLVTAYTALAGVVLATVIRVPLLGSTTLSTVWLLVAATAGAAVGRAAEAPVDADDRGSGSESVGLALRAIGLVALAIVLLLAWHLPVGAYDALEYRLPTIADWLDAGGLAWVDGDDALRNGYPLGLEAIAALVARATSTFDFVDALAPLFVAMGASALGGFLRELGVSRGHAALAAGLFLLVPIHLLNGPSGYVDAAFAGSVATLFVLVARWVHEARATTPRLVALGFATALVLAIKANGIGFAVAVLGLGAVERARAFGVRRVLRELPVLMAAALPGTFFVVRNVVHTGNPIYPVEVRLLGHLVFRGEGSLDAVLSSASNLPPELASMPRMLRPPTVWLEPFGPARDFDDRLAGLGYAFALFGLPAAIAALVRVRRDPTFPRAFVTLALATGACFALQPLSFWPRYTSWLWALAACAIALGLERLVREGRAALAASFATALSLIVAAESAHALAHVKELSRHGRPLLAADRVHALATLSGADPGFVERSLVGRTDVCRTEWIEGTEDARIDGLVAQLEPRPRMHVLRGDELGTLVAEAARRHCDALIVLGDSPMLRHVPASFEGRIAEARAFGVVHLVATGVEASDRAALEQP